MRYRYYNQTNYPHVPYPTLTDLPELGCDKTTVRDAGCGLCASCMVIENMTGMEFPLIDCLELSLNVHANHSPGTDMTLLGPYIAERFHLKFTATDNPKLMREHLAKGYMAVACVAGDRPEENYVGVFSHGGHYVAVVGMDEDKEHILVLDPSQVPGKYDIEGRREKVIVNGNILHTTMTVLEQDCRYREPDFYEDGDFKKWLKHAGEPANRMRYFLFTPGDD